VIEGSSPLTALDIEIAALIGGKPAILTINKTDLPMVAEVNGILPGAPRVEISALTGAGIADLEQAIQGAVFAGRVVASDVALVSNARHRDVLRRAHGYVGSALAAHRAGVPDDLVSIDLTAAANALGEITGETVSDTLLETIFGRFCVGK
jgi:tRNA modification GTPase